MNQNSIVWKHFVMSDDGKNVSCKFQGCSVKYACKKRQGTSNMIYHLKNTHGIDVDSPKKIIRVTDENDANVNLIQWFIAEAISFKTIEDKNFKRFVSSLNSDYKLINRKNIVLYINELTARLRREK
jgi:hypothetical protein